MNENENEIEECEGGHPLVEERYAAKYGLAPYYCTSWTCANPECVEGHTRVDAMMINELKQEIEMDKVRLVIYERTLENIQESRGYARWHLGWSDGIHYPISDDALEYATQEYGIPEDDDEWIEGFNEGQATLRSEIE